MPLFETLASMASTNAFSSLTINSLGGASGNVAINSCGACKPAGQPVVIKRVSPCALKQVVSNKNACQRRVSPRRCGSPKRCQSPKRWSPKRCSPKRRDCVADGVKNFLREQKAGQCWNVQPQPQPNGPQVAQAQATTQQVVSAAIQAAIPKTSKAPCCQ